MTTTEPPAPPYSIDERLTTEMISRAATDGVTLRPDLAGRALAIAAMLHTPPPGPAGQLLSLHVPPFVQSLAAAVWADRTVILTSRVGDIVIETTFGMTATKVADMLRQMLQPSPPKPEDVIDEPGIGSVVMDRDGDCWTRQDDGWRVGSMVGRERWKEVRRYAPLTLVTPEPEPVDLDSLGVGAVIRVTELGDCEDGTLLLVLANPTSSQWRWVSHAGKWFRNERVAQVDVEVLHPGIEVTP